MCYTENADMVHIQTETSYTGGYGQAGYRTNCGEVPFTDVVYINHDNNQKPGSILKQEYPSPSQTWVTVRQDLRRIPYSHLEESHQLGGTINSTYVTKVGCGLD